MQGAKTTANDRVASGIEESASVSLRFHLLVVFSCVIATLGLIADSAAVVIGAMLVAPLLAPIMALALSSLRGELRPMRSASLALLSGVAVAVTLSVVLAWLARALPFDALASLPHEAQARTRPNPFDLGIALAGGAIGAYALARLPGSDALPGVAIATALMPPLCTVGIGLAIADRGVWGGAALLFVTNLLAILAAAIVVFAAIGFRPRTWHSGAIPAAVTAVLLATVAVALVAFTLRAVGESRQSEAVRSAVSDALEAQMPGSSMVGLEQAEHAGALQLRATVRTQGSPTLEQVEALQAAIAQRLQRRVALVFIGVPTLVLDPLNPPPKEATLTPVPVTTPTPTATPTRTPGRIIFILPFQVALPGISRD